MYVLSSKALSLLLLASCHWRNLVCYCGMCCSHLAFRNEKYAQRKLFLEKKLVSILVIFRNHASLGHCCRNGIEGLNDDLLSRGFAMNEAGGILKVPCCIQHCGVVYWIQCVRNVHEHIPA